ncbi:MAG: DUF1592 domain-containing protein [Myxococcota bacterium]
MKRAPRHLGVWLGAVLGTACTGDLGDVRFEPELPAPPPPVEILNCDVVRPGRAPLRRLTVREYDATLRDLLGDGSEPGSRLIAEARGVSADTSVTSLLAEQYMNAAEDVSGRVTEDLDALLDCGGTVDDDCARAFIDDIGPRAFRRPMTDAERIELVSLYDAARSELTQRESVRAVLEAILQSPQFLYRVEISPVTEEAVVRLDGYQLATRLSYTLWGTMPNQMLFDAAASGALDSDEGVATIAREMLLDARAETSMQDFFAGFLALEELEDLTKDVSVFPEFNEHIAELMRMETEAFVHEVMVNGDASWQTLMRAPWSMMNRELAEYYGVSGPTGDAFERVELDPGHHSGLLTQGSVMATRARTYESSPIHRGMFVRGTLMCGVVRDVPEGLEVDPPDPDPTATTRERLAEHRANPVCASCHEQFDPLGFAFEHFDGSGRFRPDENGLPIDTTGNIVDSDIDGDFDGLTDLADQLLTSEEAQACFAKHFFRFANERFEVREDGCSIGTMVDSFRESDFDVREMMVSLTQTDAFLYRAVDQDAFSTDSGDDS